MTLPPGLVVDAERAEVRGPREAIRTLLAADDEPGPPLLAAGLRAARAPALRFHVTGFEEPLEALAGEHAGVVLLPVGPSQLALRACSPSGMLGLLVRAVALQPRPRVHAEPVTVPAARMAQMLKDRSAPGEPLLHEHLEALVAHWRIEAHGAIGWYLEVLDSERGLWTIADAPERQLTLTPTNATAVLDELAALPGHANP